MVNASVMVAVLLSAQGDAPRNEPDRKPTVVQPAEVRGTATPGFFNPAQELALLKRNKPHLEIGGAILGVGGVVSALGIAFVIFSVATLDPRGGIRNEGQSFGIMIGGAVFGLGALIGTTGGIVLGVSGAELTRADARIRELEKQVAATPPSVRFPILPPVVLARF